MSEMPKEVTESALWARLATRSDSAYAIRELRKLVELLAAKISELLPEFTDHSIRHLDALWRVTDTVLTPQEVASLSDGEALILAAALYLHDLGMAISATPEGAKALRHSASYKATYSRLTAAGVTAEKASLLALRTASRALHAEKARELALEKVPGLDRFLIENSELRDKFGANIGQVAASHHWSISDVDRILGARGRAPDAFSGRTDVGYVACALRIVDYAHINLDRSSTVERLLRPPLPADSVMHWDAQQNITGPMREGNQIVFGTTKPIASVDGWWTFYEMASGLDTEITSVRDYLSARSVSAGRFSLDGVKGAKTPQSFAVYVPTHDFEPVDVRFRPNSMERLIGILGGRTLYGNDHFAPIRELIQNARDAVLLQRLAMEAQHLSFEGEIRVTIESSRDASCLVVSDNGVGMSAHVVSNYLLGIAADYWSSQDSYAEHPYLSQGTFRPVGRFGIGFLSVFMVGTSLEVITQRRGGENLHLSLHGIGRRGALQRRSPTYSDGTTIRINLSPEAAGSMTNLRDVVMAKAPMLDIPVTVEEPGSRSVIQPKWWQTISQEEFSAFLAMQPLTATTPRDRRAQIERERDMRMYLARERLSSRDSKEKWPGNQPELLTDTARILAVPGHGHVLLCSKGFAIHTTPVSGIMGMVDIGDVELNAARSEALRWDASANRREWLRTLNAHLVHAVSELVTEGDIPARFAFLVRVADEYGRQLLIDTDLPWVTIHVPPGHSYLVSPADLLQRLRSVKEVLIVYGEGATPWSAASVARARFPDASADAIVLPVPADGQPGVGTYDDHDQVFDGPIDEHFAAETRYSAPRSPAKAHLLQATLTLIAKAWGNEADLAKLNWRRRHRRIAAHVRRPT